MNYNYEIKKLNNSRSKYFYEAMKVYCENTPDDIYTNQNEMTEFLNNYNFIDSHKHYYFAFLINGIVMGFSDIVYIQSLPMLLIDYFTIDRSYKNNCVFYTFLNMLFSYFSENNLPFKYVVTEVSNRNKGKEIDVDSYYFKVLSQAENFREIKAVYKHPPLGDNLESNIECTLLIKANDSKKSIKKETYLKIIKEIYEHYKQWYKHSKLPGEFLIKYTAKLNTYFNEIKISLIKEESVPLLTYDTLCCQYYKKNNCAYYSSGTIPINKNSFIKKLLQTILYLFIVIVLSIGVQLLISIIFPGSMVVQYIPTIISSLFIAVFLSKK